MKTYEQMHTINQPLVFVAGVTVLHAETEFLFSTKELCEHACTMFGQNIYLVLVDPMFLSSHWFWSDPHVAHHVF